MTTQYPDAQYVRVRHLGSSTGSLYLADLDDEENKKENKGVPVYVQEGQTVDIPLDEDVLHSYQQGTIRGMMDQNLLAAHIVEDEGQVEFWVSPDGDDDNPGTRNAPFKTIRHAVHYVQDEFDAGTLKKVMVKPGTYAETGIIINRPNVWVKGENPSSWSQTTVFQKIELSSPGAEPAFMVTSMTRAGAQEFLDAGGITYTDDGSTFTYTGADVVGREVHSDMAQTIAEMNCRLENLFTDVSDSDHHDLLFVGCPESGTTVTLSILEAVNCLFQGDVYCKNTNKFTLIGASTSDLVYDNSILLRALPYRSESEFQHIRFRADTSGAATEGEPAVNDRAVSYFCDPVFMEEIWFYGTDSGGVFFDDHWPMTLDKDMFIRGPQDFDPSFLRCRDFTKSGGGNLEIGDLLAEGDVTIEGAGTNEILGGKIRGNLVVNAPAAVTLNNVVVEGDISGDGDVTQQGGGYLGSNNLSGTYTHTALKTT